jgi:hypothetical protein
MTGRGWEFVRAIRGPVMLIAFGILTALDHTDRIEFLRWSPALIVVYGILKLLEWMVGPPPPPAVPPVWQQQQQPGYMPPQPYVPPQYPPVYPPPPQTPQGGAQ